MGTVPINSQRASKNFFKYRQFKGCVHMCVCKILGIRSHNVMWFLKVHPAFADSLKRRKKNRIKKRVVVTVD